MQKTTKYTKDDLTLGTRARLQKDGEVFVHTHQIEFARPLTEAERHLFQDVLQGFYYTVRFSRKYGTNLVAEPVVEFTSPQTARYTLRQNSLQGTWKELLLAILTNFSLEIAPIASHDESRAFMSEPVA